LAFTRKLKAKYLHLAKYQSETKALIYYTTFHILNVDSNIMSEIINKIKQLLKSDFENKLFNSSVLNLNDKSNDLRYHNFCYSIRELSRHFLHSLAPNVLVENCSWFAPVAGTSGPT